MELERCWGEQTQLLTEAVRGVGHREALCFIVRGGPGQGVSDVVRALGHAAVGHEATERATIWVDAVTDEQFGHHVLVSRQDPAGHGPLPASSQGTPAGSTSRHQVEHTNSPGPHPAVTDALHTIGQDDDGHGRLVLVDAFHHLPAADAAALVEWLQQQRFTDTVVVLGVHPVECPPEQAQLLSVLSAATTVDLPRLSTEQMSALLAVRHPQCPTPALGTIAEFSRGIPALAFEAADHHCLQAESEAEAGEDVLTRSLQLAIHRVCLPVLTRQGTADLRLGLTATLTTPEGTVDDVATVVEHPEPARIETLLKQIGLLGGTQTRADIVRDAVLSGTDPDHVRCAAGTALGLLERVDAPPERILELVEILGPEDGNYLAVAKRAVEGFLDRGMDERALGLALQALRRSQCPDVIGWARSVALSLAVTRDWARASTMMLAGGPQDTLVREVVASGELCPEFSMDAAHAVGAVTESLLTDADGAGWSTSPQTATAGESVWSTSPTADAAGSLAADGPEAGLCDQALLMHHHLLTGRSTSARVLASMLTRRGAVRCVDLSALLVGALRGRAAEHTLHQLEERLTETVGTFNVGAHRAALLAATHLVLANHQAAAEWSNIATLTAGPEDLSSSGLGHAIAALAQLRLGDLDAGATHAATAADTFTSLRADRLATFAGYIAAHVEIEAGRTSRLPRPPQDRWHPVFEVYATYVHARQLVADGSVDQGVAELFQVGRSLEGLGLANPTLVNWRPHLIAVFRGTHKDDFANIVETDLLTAMRRWHRVNPQGALRRSHILGARACDLTPTAQVPLEPPDTPEPIALSEAESRVVRLVVQGQSNREVARELYLSKRTIDTHLSNVYRKLGLGSRGELEEYVRAATPGLYGSPQRPDRTGDQVAEPIYG